MKKKMPTAKQMKDRQQGTTMSEVMNDGQPVDFREAYVKAAAKKKKSSSAPSATSAATSVTATSARPSAKMVEVRISDITVIAGHNARQDFNEQTLLSLSESIAEQGLIEPVIVAKDGKKLKLVAGERRLRAAKLAGEEFIEAKVYAGLSEKQIAAMALAENFDREDLNHVETARALGRCRNAGAEVKEIAASVRKSTDYVREHLDLLRLCEPIQRLVASGRLPIKHAALIAKIGDVGKQIEITEQAILMNWNSKSATWKESRESWNREKGGDYTKPMVDVRRDVAMAMMGLAAGGWPMDEDYAGLRACEGCPDNSATYADQPMLFAGIKPHGSDKKGYCTHEACYRQKEAAWAKVKAKRKADAEKKKTEKIKKARDAGLDACEDCGRIADADKEFEKYAGGKLCEKCIAKAKKKDQRGDGVEDYQAREKRVKALRRKFPWTEEQMLAVCLHGYGMKLVEKIGERLEYDPPENAERILLLITAVNRGYISNMNGFPTLADLLAGGGIDGASLKTIWGANNTTHRYEPSVGWGGKADNVPLPKDHMDVIDNVETLAKHWEVENLPARPTLEIIKRQALKDVISKGKRHEAETALAACDDAEMLELMLNGDEAIKKPAKWRTNAIKDRIGMLEMLKDADQLPTAGGGEATTKTKAAAEVTEEADNDEAWADMDATENLLSLICKGKKKEALAAIEKASLFILQGADKMNLKGDWRRSAIRNRIVKLKRADALPY